MIALTAYQRHCERSEAIHSFFFADRWIASSHPPSLEGGLRRTRVLLAMTAFTSSVLLLRRRSLESQNHIIGWHLGDLDQRQAVARREPLQRLDIAHAPFRITVAKAGVENGITDRGVFAAALERAIEI